MQLPLFLKRVLMADAASCLAMAALFMAGASTLSSLFGLDRDLVFGAGILLVPVGLLILAIGMRQAAPAFLVYLIVAGNLLWSLESGLVIANAPAITPIGIAFVAVQAAAVLAFAALEYLGMKQARQAHA